jgi:transcriptional regulator GlxA family with amidase domain
LRNVGIVVFEDAEELDFVGPWEILAYAAKLTGRDRLLLVGEKLRSIRCAKGLHVVPDILFSDTPPLDVLLVPGGQGARRDPPNAVLIEWLRRAGASATWVTSVCTGALLLYEAGLARGRRVTTHFRHIEKLRACGDVTVLERVRYVQDGNVVTAAGVSAGIDMALWLVGQRDGIATALEVQREIQYEPAPPYADSRVERQADAIITPRDRFF